MDENDEDAAERAEEAAELAELRRRAATIGYVVVKPWEKIIFEGEGADEEYELVPTQRQRTYEKVITDLQRKA